MNVRQTCSKEILIYSLYFFKVEDEKKVTFQRLVCDLNVSDLLKNSDKEIIKPIIDENGRIEDCKDTLQVIYLNFLKSTIFLLVMNYLRWILQISILEEVYSVMVVFKKKLCLFYHQS